MRRRSRFRKLSLALLLMLGVSRPSPAAPPGTISVDDPGLTVGYASPSQLDRLGEAIAAFETAGLDLPDVEVEFGLDGDICGDAHGRFIASADVMRIQICSTEADWVYVHELAHAWIHTNVTDSQRRAFMELRGYTNWSDQNRPWNERGVEGAALVIQQGLTGLPLPPALSNEVVSRLEGFELLTGQVAPILVEWMETERFCEGTARCERAFPPQKGVNDLRR